MAWKFGAWILRDGSAQASLLEGVYRHGVVRLSLAFLFLASAWAYREMDLGWDADKKSWEIRAGTCQVQDRVCAGRKVMSFMYGNAYVYAANSQPATRFVDRHGMRPIWFRCSPRLDCHGLIVAESAGGRSMSMSKSITTTSIGFALTGMVAACREESDERRIHQARAAGVEVWRMDS